ncbi:MAG: hypothetical protein ABI811_21745 [Acidobacteriota bacterium]
MMNKNKFLGSMMAVAAATVAVAIFVMGPLPMTGQQAPAKGVPAVAADKGGGKGKDATPPGPVPRLKNGKPDMNGYWGPVAPGGNVNIEPAQAKGGGAPGGAKGGGKGGPGGAPGGPGGAPGGAPVAGGPGAGKGAGKGGPGGAPAAVAGGAGPGGAPGGGAPGGAGAAKGKQKGVIIDPEDARVPYTAAARAKSDEIIAKRMFLEPELHCFMSGVPHNMWVQFNSQIVHTADNLVIMWEFMHSRRIIPTDGRPHQFPGQVRQFQGESSGKWEGDTLVVTTKNQTDHTWFDTSGHYAPKDIEVVERFTMINANQISYEATVTSPTELTQPMKLSGMISRANMNDPTYEQMEFACIEGNQDLSHYTETAGGKAKEIGVLKQ